MKHLGFILLAGLLFFSGCAREKKMTIVLEWQPPASEVCRQCQQCGVGDQEVQRAFLMLKERLAEKGFDIQVVEKKGAAPLPNTCGMKVCDVPLEVWLDARTEATPCQGAADKGDPDGMRRTIRVGNQGFATVPADLMVRAGLMAADHMIENGGKVDPAKITSPKGCAGCPSRSKCGAVE